jgi:hydrogenase small subunit
MKERPTVFEVLQERGISRRSFIKFCAATATSLGLSGKAVQAFAQAVGSAPRPSVIWLSFQQCTGCSESLTRTYTPGIENLLLDVISLDYHETLQVAAGQQAEDAKAAAIAKGGYVLVVDGAIPSGAQEWWSVAGGVSNVGALKEAIGGAGLVVALGTCATFGGLPAAYPNPSNAKGVGDLMASDPSLAPALAKLVNLSGCPPIPDVISGTIALYLSLVSQGRTGELPTLLDELKRPKPYYGKTVHDTCPRLCHYLAGNFARSFDDAGARAGHCLYLLGCKGPETFNACTTVKWNEGKYFPMLAGHGCLGCSEPDFWDKKVTTTDPATKVKTFIGGTSFYAADAEDRTPLTPEATKCA